MSINTKRLRASLLLVVGMALSAGFSGCSIFSQTEKDMTEGWSANKIYTTAKEALNSGDYERAISLYESLEARYPLGRFAQQAQLETAYAYYKYDEPDSALDAIDRYLRMNPTSEDADYAWYLRGLVNFNRGHSVVDQIFPRSIADLDTVRQKESFQDFSHVITRYPNSKYAPDAKERIQHLRNSLAESEVNVAKYYIQRGAWLAAFNRAEYAIKHYEGSPAIIEALEIKVRAAHNLGKPDLAADNMRVLELNFPQRAAALKAELR
ncbi:outer membrane protein assembly factor BamD [Candidatus Thiothrix sp. Deng01]|uniref:Outer membrane protein assembly factor BamD n=1 Tax=Candidatus Thiothrix phosphatis TaxID=3112415 RepID=A0ABU6D186_9GAMM|nr:outer membrane protein assembly factor BamD [Candidatus Thiothrix sp. Deng01]MEB4592840.1 outer membrane protein assembly factor BamD [Candidatus Thiothrix sp. Deng01]